MTATLLPRVTAHVTAYCWFCEGRKTVRTGTYTLPNGKTLPVFSYCSHCKGTGQPERAS